MIIISENELELLKEIDANELHTEEGEILLEHKDVIIKWFRKMQLNIQTAVSMGQYRGNEDTARTKIDAIQECIEGMSGIENAFIEYRKQKEESEKSE